MAKPHLMIKSHANIIAESDETLHKIEGNRVKFCPQVFFKSASEADQAKAFKAIAAYLLKVDRLFLFGTPEFVAQLIDAQPQIGTHLAGLVIDQYNLAMWETDTGRALLPELTRVHPSLITERDSVFLCDLTAYENFRRSRVLRTSGASLVDFDSIVRNAIENFAPSGWFQTERHIYPIDLPDIAFRDGLDMILLDCPARNLALMPNGLGHVHNTLKRSSISFQTFDLDILVYHRFHMHRIFDLGGKVFLENGTELPLDPWQAHNYDIWAETEVIDYFSSMIDEVVKAIIKAKPKILGFSIHQCNEAFTRRVINLVRAALPEVQVIVGGFSCYNPDIGRRAFPECDYMFIGEADLSLGPVVEALAAGERPKNVPGAISRYDDPAVPFIPAPMAHDLDQIDFPKYEWLPLSTYRLYNGYQLVPVVASRGCRWARCTFCAERFYWRIRTAKNFGDEIEWLVNQGCYLFMFNESDLNGMPERLLDICDEIINRNLTVGLTGQLRIHKKNDKAFFQKLKRAGFQWLRYGVDAFSEKGLRLQQKGYTKEMVTQTLRECHASGITTEVNWVIGVPGETEEDLDEAIDFLIENSPHIGRVANVHALILLNGSVYWIDPESHNIKFLVPKEELYHKYPRLIPSEYWYSTEPYIDTNIRAKYFEKAVVRLSEAGVRLGPWAERVVADMKNKSGFYRTATVEADNVLVELALPKIAPIDVGNHRGYKLFQVDRLFYAVPEALSEISLFETDRLPPEVLVENARNVLIDHIDNTIAWANSRGGGALVRRAPSPHSAVDGHALILENRDWNLGENETIVAVSGEFFAIDAEAGKAKMWFASSKLAELEDRGPRGEYTLVEYDLVFYAIPHFDGKVDLMKLAKPAEHGILRAASMLELRSLVGGGIGARDLSRAAGAVPGRDPIHGYGAAGLISATPIHFSSLGGYKIISFEGWVYGIPERLGELDPRTTDVMEYEGVIRDVSADVVENMILERASLTWPPARLAGE